MTKPKRNFNKNPRPTEKTLQDTVSSLVLEQVKKITANYIAGEISTGAKNGKRTLSEEGSDSDDSPETPSTKRRRNGKRSSEAPVFAAAPTLATASASSSSASSSTTAGATPPVTEISHPISYKSQVVILEGIDDALKKNPKKFLIAMKELKPNLEIVNVRLTASQSVLITPKNPKDCNSLLKEDAFPPESTLGKKVTARLPKSQAVTHQVIIKGLDVSVTEDEVKEMLDIQEMKHAGVKRIFSRARDSPTEMMRLFLKDEHTKKTLLKKGHIYLDQMRFKCVPAKEDEEKKLVFQCYKCQAWNDHKTWECKNEQKCVLCAGGHPKSACTKTKEEANCSNCGGQHGAWSRDCPKYKEAVEKKSFSSVTKATVADGFAHDMVKNMVMAVVAEIKKQIAVIIAEVTSKALLEHVFYEIESKRTQGQKSLSTNDRISSIVKMTTQAVNKAPFAQYDESQISNDDIHGEVMGRLKDSLSCNNQKAKSSSTQS